MKKTAARTPRGLHDGRVDARPRRRRVSVRNDDVKSRRMKHQNRRRSGRRAAGATESVDSERRCQEPTYETSKATPVRTPRGRGDGEYRFETSIHTSHLCTHLSMQLRLRATKALDSIDLQYRSTLQKLEMHVRALITYTYVCVICTSLDTQCIICNAFSCTTPRRYVEKPE